MENFGVINYTSYLLGTIFIVLLPGPNSLYVLTIAVQQGPKRGWSAGLGIFVGDCVLILLTVLGAATVLSTNPALFTLLKVFGALYLVYLGSCLVYSATQKWQKPQGNQQQSAVLKPLKNRQAFSKALLISLLNPKAILFFLSFFVQFIDPQHRTIVVPLLVLFFTLQIISVTYLSVLIYAGDKLATTFREKYKLNAMASAIVGIGFIAFAVKMALASAV